MLQLCIAFTHQECLNSSKDWDVVIKLNDRCIAVIIVLKNRIK
jgi:hypothetical protein